MPRGIFLTRTILYGRTIMYTMISMIEASKKAAGYLLKIFDLGKNRLQLTCDLSMKLKNEFVLDDPNVTFPYIPFQDDDTERLVAMCCSPETYPLQKASGNNEVITIADTRHIQRRSERKNDPMLYKGDLDFLCNCPCDTGTLASPGHTSVFLVSHENGRLWYDRRRLPLDTMRSSMFHRKRRRSS